MSYQVYGAALVCDAAPCNCRELPEPAPAAGRKRQRETSETCIWASYGYLDWPHRTEIHISVIIKIYRELLTAMITL